MTEQQYRKICDACDRALLSGLERPERLAVSWLHVVREHPSMLRQYADLFFATKDRDTFGGRIVYFYKSFLSWFSHKIRCLLHGRLPWHGDAPAGTSIDVLFISHLVNPSHAGKEDDFYFGALPAVLSARGHSVVIALFDHSGANPRDIAHRWRSSSVPRLIFSHFLDLLKESKLVSRMRKEARLLAHDAGNQCDGFYSRVLMRASREARSRNSLLSLRLYEQMSLLTTVLRPKTVVTTFEGHGWERLMFAAARSVFPEVRCIAYQHAAVFRLQHAIRRPLSGVYDPDIILTAGSVSARQLAKAEGMRGARIYTLGSNRALRVPIREKRLERRPRPACLVLPEGIPMECEVLFSFSVRCAQACPEVPFIWRLHPVVSWSSLRAGNDMYDRLPENIRLSKASLEEDLSSSSWALYRGTTAVIQAVTAGLRPIYLELEGELTIDPLYEIGAWRSKVRKISDFKKIINDKIAAVDTPSKSEKNSAIKYCNGFFTPIDNDLFERILLDSSERQ